MDPSKLNFDPDPKFWPNLNTDPDTDQDTDQDTDPGPELPVPILRTLRKNLKIVLTKKNFSLKITYLLNYRIRKLWHQKKFLVTQVSKWHCCGSGTFAWIRNYCCGPAKN